LSELRLTVCPQILIPKASCDLKVPVKTGDHQQLLVELRRLGQREELSGMHPAGHQVVARAFGRGFSEDGRLDLEKPVLVEKAASSLHQPMPQNEILVQFGTAEVEHP